MDIVQSGKSSSFTSFKSFNSLGFLPPKKANEVVRWIKNLGKNPNEVNDLNEVTRC